MTEITALTYKLNTGEGRAVELHNEFRKAAKTHECSVCQLSIEKGEFYRHNLFKIDGKMKAYKVCAKCCRDMVSEQKIEIKEKKTSIKKFDGNSYPASNGCFEREYFPGDRSWCKFRNGVWFTWGDTKEDALNQTMKSSYQNKPWFDEIEE